MEAGGRWPVSIGPLEQAEVDFSLADDPIGETIGRAFNESVRDR